MTTVGQSIDGGWLGLEVCTGAVTFEDTVVVTVAARSVRTDTDGG